MSGVSELKLNDDYGALRQCLRAMQSHHQVQEAICDALEEVADSLPHALNRQFCLELARALFPIVKSAQSLEEDTLFPLLKRLDPGNVDLAKSLERLTFEHWEDEVYALDVAEVLMECGRNGLTKDAEYIGYLLRGFFSNMRRHIAYEKDYIIRLVNGYVEATMSETAH